MSSLLAMFGASGNALDVFQQALSVVQNNVNNSSTPGFARQSLNLEALPLDVAGGLAGGVASAGLHDSRNQYAEEQLQRQTQLLGQFTAQSQATGSLQSLFDASGSTGLSATLSSLYQSFSSWSTTPSDTNARQAVIAAAGDVASSLNGLANSLSQNSQQLNQSISSTVTQINTIAGQIQAYNQDRLTRTTPDPGEDAQLHSALDNLSQLTNFSTVTQSDGTVTVLLGGGSPLVMGTQQYSISASFPSDAQVTDSQGNDITSQITSGQLGGMLDTRNRVLPALIGDSSQPGMLNNIATALAGVINQTLESGTVSSATGAPAGSALFTFGSADPTAAAATIAVNPTLTPDQLAPVDSSGVANGNANQLAALATTPLSQLNNMSITDALGQLTAFLGNENSTATDNQQSQQQVVAQATTLVNQVSGVSLDAEAVSVLQFQRSYQAAAQVLTVLNTLADSVMNLIPPY